MWNRVRNYVKGCSWRRGIGLKKIIYIIVTFIIMCNMTGCNKKSETSSVGNVDTNVTESNSVKNDSKTVQWPTKTWSKSSPKEQGIDEELLSNADTYIKKNNPNVYSLLVVRHGYLVYEKYYNGADENSANQVYSVTKSVNSALAGIALREKVIDNIDQKVSEFLPEYFNEIDNEKKKDITIRNVLTMTGGLETVEEDDLYWSSNDFFAYALNKPLTNQPGESFEYNTGLTHFLSRIISKNSNMSTKEFADKNLFEPIGISVQDWYCDSQGYNCGGTGLFMTPLDMARFGILYLNNGMWDGKQIIPQEWIEESTKKQISGQKGDYGYLFWIKTVKDYETNKEYLAYSAEGYGGQIIMMIPELDMVTVVTANDKTNYSSTMDIIKFFVVPSAK